MSATAQELAAKLATMGPELIDVLRTIALNPRTPVKDRLKAIEMALDRGGAPAVKATVTQTVSASFNPKELLGFKQELFGQQEKLQRRISQIRHTLAPPPGEHEEVVIDASEEVSEPAQ